MLQKADILKLRPGEENVNATRMLRLNNLDEMFASSQGARIINDETLVGKNLAKDFTDAIYSISDSELGFVPTCSCGATFGKSKLGITCPDCGTECSSKFIDALSYTSWIGIPEHMPPVLHPTWYWILRFWTTITKDARGVGSNTKSKDTDKVSIRQEKLGLIDFILNPELERSKEVKQEIPEDYLPYLRGRGFKYFYEHADEILDDWMYNYPKTVKKVTPELIKFREMYRDVMFTKHLPILHNSLHPITSNGATLNYIDKSSKFALSATINLSAEGFREHSSIVTESRRSKALYNVYMDIVDYYWSLIDEKLAGKGKIERKQIFGSRVHNSFRTVVHPHDRVLPMDEVLLPWGIMVQGLEYPILNYLVNRKRIPLPTALDIHTRALIKYDPLIDECITTYINECPEHKLPILLGRNPKKYLGVILVTE